jgi:hypothetical protein
MKVLGWKAGQSFIKVGGYFRLQYDQFKREEIAKNIGWSTPLPDLAGWKVKVDDEFVNVTKDNLKAIRKKIGGRAIGGAVTAYRTDGHVNSRATRRTIKLFLGLTWMQWREIEGLLVHAPYAGGMMGHEIITPDEMLAAEERLKAAAKKTRKAKAEPNEA